MLTATRQHNQAPSGASLRHAIEVNDNGEEFVRRLAEERLQRDYGWSETTCRFLLARHKLPELTGFAKRSMDALRQGLWLYALDEQDLQQAELLPEQARSCLRFAWYPKTKKNIYGIGESYYATFLRSEIAQVQQCGMTLLFFSSFFRLTLPGKTLYDLTVATKSTAAKCSHSLVRGDDDPNDADWSPEGENATKRATAKKTTTAKKPSQRKQEVLEAYDRAPSPPLVLDLGSPPPSLECSPARAESLPLVTRSRKAKADEQQLVLYDSARPVKKSRLQDFELQLQLHESQAERRIVAVEHDREMDTMRARLAQMELEKRMAILVVEKRASDERATLLLGVNDKELAVKQKEIDLLREKECFLTDKCSFLETRRPAAPQGAIDVPVALPMVRYQQQPPQQQQQQLALAMDVEQPVQPMRPVEAAPTPMRPERVALHAGLRTFVNRLGRFNLSVEHADFYDLRDVLQKVLTTNQAGAPLSEEDDALLRSGLLNDYVIFLRNNNNTQASSQEREQQLFALDSSDNRVNCSNILLHYAFLRKARAFNALVKINKKTGLPETKHAIVVVKELHFEYGRDCSEQWFPKLTHGCDTIVSESLRFYAQSHKSGAGDGKMCPFCCKNYFNYSGGSVKNMHQLSGCDVLANLSQNERVVLEAILRHRAASNDFAKHDLIAVYSEHSYLRRATQREITDKHYGRCKLTGDRVRLNMQVFMKLRFDTWEEWMQRLSAFSTSKTELYNLNAQPLARMVDALGIETPAPRRAAITDATSGSPPKPCVKKIVAPKPRPGQQTPEQRREAKHRERISRCRNTFLGKVLLNHRGDNYLANLPMRDFTIDSETGFGDGMYFETALEQEQRERQATRLAQLEQRQLAQQQEPVGMMPPLPPFDFRFVFPMPVFPPAQLAPVQLPPLKAPPKLPGQFAAAAMQRAPAPVGAIDPLPPMQQQANNTNDAAIDETWRLPLGDHQMDAPLGMPTSFESQASSEYNTMFANAFGEPHTGMFGAPANYDLFGTPPSSFHQDFESL
jgi:hypothetical protein